MNAFLIALSRVKFRPLAITLTALVFASAASIALLLMRRFYSGERSFGFLVWNLILAWIPLGFAVLAWLFHHLGRRGRWLFWLSAAAWLVWFPNAPYIFTDLVHLRQRQHIPFWYDMMLILSFATTGLLLGFFSLNLMHRLVAQARGWLVGWAFTAGVIALAGFGVFLGRFIRWNTWDLIFNPLNLLRDIAGRLADPFAHANGLAFAVMFAIFLWVAYVMLYCVTYWHPQLSAQTRRNFSD